jgi:hypothetical protein
MRAKSRALRRQELERKAAVGAAIDQPDELIWADLRRVLDGAVNDLPAPYREAFVLCCMQGITVTEAARRLGCPQGTVAGRLARAKERLRNLLGRRGLAPALAGLAVALAESEASASVTASLAARAVEAAAGVVVGHAVAAAAVPAKAIFLKKVVETMSVTKFKTIAAVVLASGVLAAGFGVRPRSSQAGQEQLSDSDTQKVRAATEARSAQQKARAQDNYLDKKLQALLSVKFTDTPLRMVLEDLRTSHGLNIFVNNKALEEAGISLDRPVTVQLEQVTLKTALNLILSSALLSYMVRDRDGYLLVTTPDDCRSSLTRKVYSVGSLVGKGQGEALIQVLTNSVEPRSWQAMGGSGTIDYFAVGRCLVVVQSDEIHAQLRTLLDELRALVDEAETK